MDFAVTETIITTAQFNPSIEPERGDRDSQPPKVLRPPSLSASPVSPGNAAINPNGRATEESATMRTLTVWDREMFAKFRIPDSLLAGAGICRVTDHEAREKWGFDKNSATADMSGIAFPYHAPETGHRVSVRIRRDNPEIDADGKPQNQIQVRLR